MRESENAVMGCGCGNVRDNADGQPPYPGHGVVIKLLVTENTTELGKSNRSH